MLIVVKVLIFFNKKALQGQGRIQAENIRAQMLWAPKKNVPMLLSYKILSSKH